MKYSLLVFSLMFSFVNLFGQCDDVQIQSFNMNTTGELADYNTNCCPPTNDLSYTQMDDSAGVTSLWYNNNFVYVNTNSLASFTMGPWATAKVPADQDVMIKLPRTVTEDTSGDQNTAESGTVGIAVDGVIIFSETTSGSYNNSDGTHVGGDGIWNEDAWVDEAWSLDSSGNGHTNASGKYHYHASPIKLYDAVNIGHSPIIGWGLDGVPIYGPYGYSDSIDASSTVVRMETGYALRNITDRTTLADGTVLTSDQYGPSLNDYVLGTYVEDNEYLLGLGHLDEHNGRWCFTPEYPSGIYAYFITEDVAGEPVYPYFIGPEFYGETANGTSIAANASEYDPSTCSTVPVAAFTAGATEVCNASSTIFTDASTETPTSWSWDFSPATVTYLNSTSSASQNPEVQFDATGTYTVTLTATNGSGNDSEVKSDYITVSSLLSAAGAITGSTSESEHATGITYSIDAVSGATGYTWTVPTGASITNGSTTSTITVTFGTTSGNVEVTPTNACGNGTSSTTTVTLTVSSSSSSSTCALGSPVTSWNLNTTNKTASFWSYNPNTDSYTFNNSSELADVLSICYDSDTVWIESEGMTDNMGQFSNPGDVNPQGYGFKFPRNPVAGTGDDVVPAANMIGVLTNGIPMYGLSDGTSYNAGMGENSAQQGENYWVGDAYFSEGYTLDTAFAAHPQQSGAYHSHATPFRLYEDPGTGNHSALLGYANDGFPVYGPFAYTDALDSTSSLIRMTSGYELRSITERTILPDGTNSDKPGPDVTTNGDFDIGMYIQDYEYLGTGTLDEHNGRLCVTPEYPEGTYAYFITVDAAGTPIFPYYIATTYYGTQVTENNAGTAVTPASGVECYDGSSCDVPVVSFSGAATDICESASTTFTDASTNTPTSWEWEFTPNTVTYLNTTSATSQNPEVQFDADGDYTVVLTATNSNGSGSESKAAYITVNAGADDAGSITGSTAECENVTGITYSIDAVTNATGYDWTVPTNATITSGTGTNTITVSFVSTSGTIDVTPTNTCGNGAVNTTTVTLTANPNAAGTITGSTAECENASGVIYSIADVTGATAYAWTVPTNATITSGTTTNTITVDFGADSGTIQVTPSNTCGDGAVNTTTVTLTASPASTGTITGSSSECENASGIIYSIDAVTGSTGYNWSVPDDATITNGSGTTTITVTFADSSGNVEVTPTFSCGNGTTSSTAITLNAVPDAAGVITGSLSECENTTGIVYSIDAVIGATGYNWTVPSDASITNGSTTNTITVSFGTAIESMVVTATNTCGNGTASTTTVTLTSTPAAAGTITGSTDECENASGVVYSIADVIDATGYIWSVPSGAAITSGSTTNTITVDFATTSGEMVVTPTNTCGSGTVNTTTVTLTVAPASTGTITGSTSECVNTTGITYSISAVTGAIAYTWSVPSDATITSSATSNSITVTFADSSGNVTVTPTFSCGNGTTSSTSISLTALPDAAGSITGSLSECENTTGIIYSIDAVTGATGYVWSVPSDASITSGSSTNTITVDFGTAIEEMIVTPTNSCGNGTVSTTTVTLVASPSAAGVITGSTAECENTSGIVYSIAAVTGATGYTWSVPSDASITSGSTTNTITVDFGTAIEEMVVTPTNTCGSGMVSTTTVTLTAGASAAGSIIGSSSECVNTIGVTYSLTAVTDATGYDWAVPTDASITSGAGTNTITVSFGIISGNVEVTPTSVCGDGTATTTAVSLNATPNAAGSITGSVSECENETGIVYSIDAVTGATGYVWSVPAGATITSGSTTNTITVDFLTTSGEMVATPTNTCGSGTASTATITLTGNPSAAGSISGSITECENASGVIYSISDVADATGYNWTLPSGATITSGLNTNTITVDFANTSGEMVVTPTNTCGSGSVNTTTVTLTASPASTGAITGVTIACENETAITYSIADVTDATGYNWSVPSDAIITSGTGTTNIVVTFADSSGNVEVTPTFACGNGTTSSISIALTASPDAAGTITGSSSVCENTTGETYSIAAVAGATAYDWTVPSGAIITSGSTTNTITVDFGTATGNVEVTPSNTCANGTTGITTVTIKTTPSVAGSITGSTTECENASGVVYSIADVTDATEYSWTLPSNATITSGSNTNTITVDFITTSGEIKVIPSNTCGNGTASTTTVTLTTSPAATGTITGVTSECANVTGITYSIAAVTNATGYNWVLPADASITSGSGTTNITVTYGDSSGNIEVTPTFSCGNGTTATTPIALTALPDSAGVITGSLSECETTTGVSYSITAVTGATAYTWNLPTGATIASGTGTNIITVDFTTNSGNVEVIPTNTCGNGTASFVTVNLTGTLGTTGAITGSTTECLNGSGVEYSVAAVANATTYAWSVPSGASITSGATTNTITVDFATTSGDITVTPSNTCSTALTTTLTVALSASTGTTGAITGSLSECENATGIDYSISPVSGATGYVWHIPLGASITSGANTNSITVTFDNTPGVVEVFPTFLCGNGTKSTATVTIVPRPAPADTLIGLLNVCENATAVTYSITTVPGAMTYHWFVPSDASIQSGIGTNAIVVDFGIASGNITVIPNNICGNGGMTSEIVDVISTPAAAGTISGLTTTCENATGITYSITAVADASAYSWTIPADATITNGGGSNAITISFGVISGAISVTPTNACGYGTVSTTTVTLTTALGSVGAVTGNSSICEFDTDVEYSIASVTGATVYNWSVPQGATVTNGAGTNSITVSFGNAAGKVEVTSSNDCESNNSFIEVTINTIDTTLSIEREVIKSNESNATYQWFNCNNGDDITNETKQSYSPTTSGEYAVVISKNGCESISNCYNFVTIDTTTNTGNNNSDPIIDTATSTGINNSNTIVVAIEVYPNPSSNNITIDLGDYSKDLNVLITTTLGQEVYNGILFETQTIINVADWIDGVYIINLVNDELSETIRMIKN